MDFLKSVWSAAFKVGGAVSRLHEQSSRPQPWSQKETRYETSITRKEDGFGIALQTIIPGYEIPWWITHQRLGNSISIELPPNWCNSKWMGFALCASSHISVEGFHLTGKTFGLKVHVIARGDMPHSYYATEISFAQNLLRGTFGYCICLVMIGNINVSHQKICHCPAQASPKTIFTDENFGRRFWSSGKYKQNVNCGFFEWEDPEMCPYGRSVMHQLQECPEKIDKDKVDQDELAMLREKERMLCIEQDKLKKLLVVHHKENKNLRIALLFSWIAFVIIVTVLIGCKLQWG
ncbi:hypothetical protein CMV_027887 [Castanea mollissima]|uniref:C-JID domain-containing protein n=1 Tax=Castanea mollissima TaxID=60419 RepID=A0A8J4QHC3_9ROSI|nr:hypothetical protein CMV_027887 [Castanea mollissima]